MIGQGATLHVVKLTPDDVKRIIGPTVSDADAQGLAAVANAALEVAATFPFDVLKDVEPPLISRPAAYRAHVPDEANP